MILKGKGTTLKLKQLLTFEVVVNLQSSRREPATHTPCVLNPLSNYYQTDRKYGKRT